MMMMHYTTHPSTVSHWDMLLYMCILILSLCFGQKYFKGLSECTFLSSIHHSSFLSISPLPILSYSLCLPLSLPPFLHFHLHVSKPFFSSLSGGGTPLGTVGARAPQASLEPERSLQTLCLRPDRPPLYQSCLNKVQYLDFVSIGGGQRIRSPIEAKVAVCSLPVCVDDHYKWWI